MFGNMLAAVKSLHTDCLVAMGINGECGDSHHPSLGLKQGCPLSATLFGLFIDGLHQYLQDAVPDAGVRVQHLRITDLKYADDVCLLACFPDHLQSLIVAMECYCSTIHMEISTPKTKIITCRTPCVLGCVIFQDQ